MMKKYLLAIGLVLALVLAAPVATRAESLNAAQLRAIIASLQAQLNFLIAKLQLQIQQQNQNTPTPTPTYKPSITITSPQTGDKLISGSNININFSSPWPYDTNCFNRLELLDASGKVIGSLMPIKGQQIVAWNTASIRSYTCGTGNVDLKINPGTYRFRIKTISADGNNEVVIYNSGYFTITSSTPEPSIIITSPNGGESWAKGSTHNITWSGASGLNVVINLKEFGSSSCFNDITSSNVPCIYTLSNGETSSWVPWTISSGRISGGNVTIPPGNYVVEVCQQGVLSNCDSSDNYFTITSATPSLKATLNVTALNGAIQCFRAPCEFPLNGAQVTVYDANKALVGNQIVGSSGVATFSNLNPGTYTVYVGASGYTQTSGQTVGLVSGQSAGVKIPVFLTR